MTGRWTAGPTLGRAGSTEDFDVRGTVGVRLVDARPEQVRRVERQLGPVRRRLDREPDVVVRFVDRIPTPAIDVVGRGETGFDDRDFYLLTGRGGVPATTVVPFADAGRRCEVVCERHVPSVPHLLALVNLAALAKGVLPLHASAFVHQGRGVLVTGWAKGGKTEVLLAFTARGARFVGDEWIYLDSAGGMHGVPEPLRVWAWQLRQQPQLLERLPRQDRRTLRVLEAAARVAGRSQHLPAPAPVGSVLRRLAPVVERQAYRQVPPATLFGAGALSERAHADALVLVLSSTRPGVALREADPREVAARMAASLAEERQPFLAHYRQFRFAFPDRVNPLVEGAEERERQLLEERLGRLPVAHVVTHPYPPDIDALYEPIRSALAATPAAVETA